MAFETGIFQDNKIHEDFIDWLVETQWPQVNIHFEKLWNYYANPSTQINDSRLIENGHRYIQAQELGLPSRITGYTHTGSLGTRQLSDVQRKEVVIENDIAWRINAIVDFLFGKPVSIISKSPDSGKSAEVEMLLKALFSANGAIGFFQDMAVLGSVYGFVDCFVRPGEQIFTKATSPSFHKSTIEDAIRLVQTISLELIEAPRACSG